MTAPPAPVVSVILAVRNEAEHIGEQLAALSRQTFDEPWELVVVDHDSTDETVAIVRSWETALPSVTIAHEFDARGTAGVRNHGVDVAAAELLAFCDGDDIVADDWLAAIVQGLRAHDVITGPRDYTRLNPPHTTPYLPPRQGASRVGPAVEVFGSNFGARRSTYEALGRMSDEMPYGEDVDFALTAHAAGVDVAYVDDALVHRRVPHTFRGVLRQHFRYGRVQVLLYARHRRRFKVPISYAGIAREYGFLVVRFYWLFHPSRRLHWAMVAGRHAGRCVESVRRRVLLP